jgi:hypothetical protein
MGSIRQGCLGIRQASSQWKTFFLTLGHFCGYESKLVCFISTIGKKKPTPVLEMLPSIKIHLQWRKRRQLRPTQKKTFFP